MDKYNFHIVQKIVVFSKDKTKILLCKRKGEDDYDGTFSFIGGKFETSDDGFIQGVRREKEEEIGTDCSLFLYPRLSHNVDYTKNDGTKTFLPHFLAIYESGDVVLNDEYSEYTWVTIEEAEKLSPIIPNIPEIAKFMQGIDYDEADLIRI